MKKLIFLFFPIYLNAQDVSIGSWKDYQSYRSSSHISESKNKVYCVSSGALFYVNKNDNTINRLSKINGLSDISIKQTAYCKDLDITVITYENCNIDLIKNTQIINLSEIKRKEITGLKSINNITIYNKIAYLSCSFGLVLIDLEKEEVKDTYNTTFLTENLAINGCAFYQDTIMVASSNGLYFNLINSIFIADFNSWTLVSGSSGYYKDVITSKSGFSINNDSIINSISYNNNTLIKAQNNKLELFSYSNSEESYAELIHENLKSIKYAWIDTESTIWVADSINGLLKFVNFKYDESYIPQGPFRNDLYSLEYEGEKLYQCHGGHANFGENALINDGVSIKDNYDNWMNYNSQLLGNSRDILEVAVNNNKEYFASWYHGIIEMENSELIAKYGFANTNGVLDTTYYSNNRIRISDLKFDSKGNLWALSSEVNHPIVVKTPTNDWHSFSINQSQVGLFFDDLIIDRHNQKWGVLGRGNGLVIFTTNQTIENKNDDEYKLLNTNIGSGNLPSMQTYSLAEDMNGEVWVGTDQGIAVFYNPENIFSGYNFDSQQILITQGDYGQYLLSEERVKCILIDGANRKWIGTENSGVFLLSEDGLNEILHFTKDNSPLFSNNIIDIAINHENGEVFFGTEKGVLSYRSDATKGTVNQGQTKVFPNPVHQDYNGPIAIDGLTVNANVKITDVSGNLVYETIAKGGQAIWNGKNKDGKRASTGVYLVLSTDLFGEEKIVSKILFVH